MLETLDCVGCGVRSAAELGELTARLLGETLGEGGSAGTRWTWTDAASGARLLLYGEPHRPARCLKPSFRDGGEVTGTWRNRIADPLGCRFCFAGAVELPGDGAGETYSLLLEVEGSHDPASLPERGAPCSVAATAFALEARAAPAPPGAAPAGTLVSVARSAEAARRPRTLRAEAVVTATVVAAETRRNGATGQSFEVVTVELPGWRLPVLLPPGPAVEAGDVLQTRCWLIGRVTPSSGA